MKSVLRDTAYRQKSEVIQDHNTYQLNFDNLQNHGDSHRSSPHYQQSNGLAERFVQSVKKMLSKSKQDGKDPYIAMLKYRNTPLENLAQLLMNRRLRTTIPTIKNRLKPKCEKHLLKTKEDKIEQTSLEEANENNHKDFDNITDEQSLEPSFVRRSERSVKNLLD
ncbi:unnamed protein product [Mytilus coruscus]|uniref:Integrase catalytic domain-containing protein n=1 Tax=Mytilus coruscus TaxID=42192 RepID=A0A6J8CLE0_MYTCO|nr:unnamed protein product [Mytilus coruscus]